MNNNHRDCKMKFRNQFAVNLVKILAPVITVGKESIVVDTAFDLADLVVARIEADRLREPKATGDVCGSAGKTAEEAAFDRSVKEVREKAAATASAPAEEERRFFLITDEGLVYPGDNESLNDFVSRVLSEVAGS